MYLHGIEQVRPNIKTVGWQSCLSLFHSILDNNLLVFEWSIQTQADACICVQLTRVTSSSINVQYWPWNPWFPCFDAMTHFSISGSVECHQMTNQERNNISIFSFCCLVSIPYIWVSMLYLVLDFSTCWKCRIPRQTRNFNYLFPNLSTVVILYLVLHFSAGFQIHFQGRVPTRKYNGSISTTPTKSW